jgi:hypothetical protein
MPTPSDARRLLGLGDDADAEAVKAARRRLAKQSHPDLAGGSGEAMRRVNEAAETVLAQLAVPQREDRRQDAQPPRPQPTLREGHGRYAHDVASFVIEALPAEAFEASVVVASWLGEVINDEPPYQLDVMLTDPLRCWCRLDLLPDAGASTVSLTIAALPDEPLPDIDDVRDLWVASLNQLGAPQD